MLTTRLRARFALTSISLSLLLCACQGIPPDNPYDPQAPELAQAPGQVIGELFTSEPSGDLRGGVVYLSGSSQSAVLDCLDEQVEGEGPCPRARFSFGAVPPGAYEVRLSAPCFSAQPFAAFELGIGELIDLTSSSPAGGEVAPAGDEQAEGAREAILVRYARGLVSGQVTGPSALELTGVRVSDARGALATPDEEGRFQLEMAACEGQLQASLEGYRSVSSTTLTVPVSDELELEEPLFLEPIPAILIGSLDAGDEPLPEEGVTLTLERASTSSPAEDIVQQVSGTELYVEDIPTGAWHLRVAHPSFQTVERRVELQAATRGSEDAYELGVIRLTPAMGSLSGQVSLEGAQAEVPIYVELVEGPSAGLQQQTSSTGAYQFNLIRGGTYRVAARAYGFVSGQSAELVTVLGDEEATAPALTLALNPGVVRGVALRPEGLEEVQLSLSLGSEVTQSQDERACEEGLDCLEGARCEEGSCLQPLGYFQFDRVPAGEYSLTMSPISDPRLRALTSTNVRVEPGEQLSLTPLALERATGKLLGTVRLPDLSDEEAFGPAGLAEARVDLRTDTGQLLSLNLDPESGLFEYEGAPVGTHLLTVSHPDYLTSERPAAIDADGARVDLGSLDLEVNPVSVSGAVQSESLEPLVGVSVSIGEALTLTDERGAFSFSGLRAGRYALRASLGGYEQLTVEELTLAAGEERALSPLTLQHATGSVSGQVSLEGGEATNSALIQLQHLASGEERLALADLSGAWRLESLRVGSYNVTVSAPNYITETTVIEVEEGLDLSLNHDLLYDRGCVQGQLTMTDGDDSYSEVSVTLLETVAVTQGDEQGRFLFDELIPGTYTLSAARSGYDSATAVVTVGAGQSCDSPSLTLTLNDRQAPSAPLVSLTAAYEYTPLANADPELMILKAEWDERGRALVLFKLDVEEGSPLDDENFDPSSDLGQWLLSINGGVPFPLTRLGEAEESDLHYERVGDVVYFSALLSAFDVKHDEGLERSRFLQSHLGLSARQLAELGDDQAIIEAFEASLPPAGTIERQRALTSLLSPRFELAFLAVDSVGNRSESLPLYLKFDLNPPESRRILKPDECNLTQSDLNLGGRALPLCHTNRETLNLRLSSPSPDQVCAYLITLTPGEAQSLDLASVSALPLDQSFPSLSLSDDCLSPSAAQLISTGEQTEGARVYCLFSVDGAGRLAISSRADGGLEDFCASILRDITPPGDFTVAPHSARLRGERVDMNITQEGEDSSLSHYEVRNLTTGTEYREVSLEERVAFLSPSLAQGALNELQVRAVDVAGNTSEPVTVTIFEDSIRSLTGGLGGSVATLESAGDQRVWLRSSACTLDNESGAAQLSGRGCHAELFAKNGLSPLSNPRPLPPLRTKVVSSVAHSFSEVVNPLPIEVSAAGALERLELFMRLSFTVGETPDLLNEAAIYLLPPNSLQPITLSSPLNPNQDISVVTHRDGELTLLLDSAQDELLAEALTDKNSFGLWQVAVQFSDPINADLISLELTLDLAEEEITRCIIACQDRSDDHTGRGLAQFQLNLSGAGLMLTQYTELEFDKVHQVRYWASGEDGELGTGDDYGVLLDDHPDDYSLPVLALTGSKSRLSFARAREPSTFRGQEVPNFSIHSFALAEVDDLNSAQITEAQLIQRVDQFDAAALKSIKLVGKQLWVIYTDLSETPVQDHLELIYLGNDVAPSVSSRQRVHFTEPADPSGHVRPVQVTESNGRLLLLLEHNGKQLLKQLPRLTQLSRAFRGSSGDNCSCATELLEQLCFTGELCFELERGGYCFEPSENRDDFDCEQSYSDCDLPICGSLISMDPFGLQVVVQTYDEVSTSSDEPYLLTKLPLFTPELRPAPLYASSEPMDSVQLNHDRISFISNERSATVPFEIETHEQMMGDLGADEERHNLKAGQLGLLERRGEGLGATLYFTSRSFGSAAQPITLPSVQSVFGDADPRPVTPDPSWAGGRGYTVATNGASDRLYVIVKKPGSGERALLRASVTTLAAEPELDWEPVATFTREVHELRVIYTQDSSPSSSRYLIMVGLDHGATSAASGPVMIIDDGLTPLSWSYPAVGDVAFTGVAGEALSCQRVAITEEPSSENNKYLLGCAAQESGEGIQFALASLTLSSLDAAPTLGQTKVRSAGLTEGLLLQSPSFSSEADAAGRLVVYQLDSLQVNPQGDLLLELIDDQVGRLYWSKRNYATPANPVGSFEPFEQVYARISYDQSQPLFTSDSLVFTDELETQEPEVMRLSITDRLLERLSLDDSPQYSPTLVRDSLFWFDERYVNSEGEELGVVITRQQSF